MISGTSEHLDGGKGSKPAPIRTEGYCLMASSAWMRKLFWKQAVKARGKTGPAPPVYIGFRGYPGEAGVP